MSLNGAAHFARFTLSRYLALVLDFSAVFASIAAIFVTFAIRTDSNVFTLALII